VGGGDEGGVVVPAEPGAAFEVVEAEGVFEFSVVVFDAPSMVGKMAFTVQSAPSNNSLSAGP
jgi:hypothetical protein